MLYPFRNILVRSARQAAALILFTGTSLHAQMKDTAVLDQPPPRITSVKALIGLPGIAPNSVGTLSFNGRNLRFTTEQGFAEIPHQRIIEASSGDERIETGGTTGKIARMLIPYGGGLAVGAVTHKKVGLLTIEFTDGSGEYHGAVFVLDAEDIANALDELDVLPPTTHVSAIAAPTICPTWKVQENAVRVEKIEAGLQSEFPPEDRVLLYERLVQQLKSEKTILNVYRAGSRSAEGNCAEFRIKVKAIAFNKGDQAVRASVGPLGHFVGTTKLNYHLTVSTQDGTPIFDQDLKNSEGSDSDSLNVTKIISKAVVKSLKKSRKHLRKTQIA
ncbi:MAG TPA: hypothetical protein VGG18_12365 [Granulicella sp.]|jgi:hypothetical protein